MIRSIPVPGPASRRRPPATPAEPVRERAAGGRFWAGAALVAAVGVTAYLTSFSGKFVLDDHDQIVDNSQIRHLWPIGSVVAGAARPVVEVTLAINYALGGLDPRGYHAMNVAIHVLAALVLFALLVRTFQGARLRDRFGPSATGLATAATLIWVAHPLQTEAVTYIIQRGESLAGFFYLTTLLAAVRGGASEKHGAAWYSGAVALCALGMATKPVMITAPLAVLVYDRVFSADSWRLLFTRRWGLYVGLAATWSIVAYLTLAVPNPTAGFGITMISPLAYAMSQPGVILHYLRLALWPSPLVLDYGWPAAAGVRATLLPALPLAALGAATVWALWRRAPIGFLGAWFFLTLAPSSSVIPIQDLAFEHRMYLPLAAVAVLVVVTGHAALRRWESRTGRRGWPLAVALTAVIVVALAGATWRRNLDYADEISLWADIVARRPENPRGYQGLGAALLEAGQDQRAIPYLLESLRRQPMHPAVLYNLGVVYLRAGRTTEALVQLDQVLTFEPSVGRSRYLRGIVGRAYYNRGIALAKLGRNREAIASYRAAMELIPDDPTLHPERGITAAVVQQLDQAMARYPEFAVAPDADPAASGVIRRTYGRTVNGQGAGHVRVLIDFTGPEVHVRIAVKGEIPQRVVDDLSAAASASMTQAGAERVAGPLAPSDSLRP